MYRLPPLPILPSPDRCLGALAPDGRTGHRVEFAFAVEGDVLDFDLLPHGRQGLPAGCLGPAIDLVVSNRHGAAPQAIHDETLDRRRTRHGQAVEPGERLDPAGPDVVAPDESVATEPHALGIAARDTGNAQFVRRPFADTLRGLGIEERLPEHGPTCSRVRRRGRAEARCDEARQCKRHIHPCHPGYPIWPLARDRRGPLFLIISCGEDSTSLLRVEERQSPDWRLPPRQSGDWRCQAAGGAAKSCGGPCVGAVFWTRLRPYAPSWLWRPEGFASGN